MRNLQLFAGLAALLGIAVYASYAYFARETVPAGTWTGFRVDVTAGMLGKSSRAMKAKVEQATLAIKSDGFGTGHGTFVLSVPGHQLSGPCNTANGSVWMLPDKMDMHSTSGRESGIYTALQFKIPAEHEPFVVRCLDGDPKAGQPFTGLFVFGSGSY